jgi:arylsulfatase
MNEHPEFVRASRPNILVLCMDQWQTHMKLPADVELPALRRLEARGVTFDRHYCTVPICTPSRATMWTGVHAKRAGLWDNTNFAWIHELSSDVPTIGHMLREQGYYTAFKGKWHCSGVPLTEDALERYGFADFQQWGEMFGAPLQGEQLDGAVAFEAIDWLEHQGRGLEQPWLLVCSLVNPHDVMFLQTDPAEAPHPNGAMAGLQTTVQRMGWFQTQWELDLPENFHDDLTYQPYGVRHYKEQIELNYGQVPPGRDDLWIVRRNYLVNAMRLVDAQFLKVLDALDRLDLWRNTVVIFTGDHGEMNGAHHMAQKGAIPFDEAAVVNLTVCVPGGPRGRRTSAVGSHLDLAPTLLEFAGMTEREIRERHPHLKGRSLRAAILHPDQDGPRGSARAPGDGALYCWDGLHSLDKDWALSGALQDLTDFGLSGPHGPETGRDEQLKLAGERYGTPDFSRRTFYRTLVDGQYKLVRWFSPEDYNNPRTLRELYDHNDVALYDLENDPGELDNIGHPDHPRHDPSLVEHLLEKLQNLVWYELGDDGPPFETDLFGTRRLPGGDRETARGPEHPFASGADTGPAAGA